MIKVLLNNVGDTIKLGKKIAKIAKQDEIICLKGDLGTGKKTGDRIPCSDTAPLVAD